MSAPRRPRRHHRQPEEPEVQGAGGGPDPALPGRRRRRGGQRQLRHRGRPQARNRLLVLEAAKGNPNNNLLAVKEGQENDPRVKKLAKLLTSPEVKKFIEDKYAGSVLASF
ncbi:hypothetical protein SHKM778_63680 [Streptomyces sp. KM77-8]|uniref:Uncharacterized protein n=1 Tax=Streptomyces haneummycinicus TaxID=3074435 RepID=A0AAT9HR05_9ACTN